MRILVSGGLGQVGSALAAMGKERGLKLFSLSRAELDITDHSSIAAAVRKYQPEILINAAAYTAVDKAESRGADAYMINEIGTALLADACVAADIPMLHLSTDYVFDGSKEGAYVEEDPLNPLSIYGKSKAAGESALRRRVERHIILRTSWVFGTQGNNFVKSIVRLAKDRGQLEVIADQFGGPSSARGIATALLEIAIRIMQSGDVTWGTYHYCEKPYVSWFHFATEIVESAAQLGVLSNSVEIFPVTSSQYGSKAQRPANSRLDTTKFESQFDLVVPAWYDSITDVIEAGIRL